MNEGFAFFSVLAAVITLIVGIWDHEWLVIVNGLWTLGLSISLGYISSERL